MTVNIRETAAVRDESRDSGQEAFVKQRPDGWRCSGCQCWWAGPLTDAARCNCPLEEELWERCPKPLVYQQGQTLRYENDVILGEVFALEDGIAHFWPGVADIEGKLVPLNYASGAWSSHLLRAISDHLELLNAPLFKEWDRYFSERDAAERRLRQRMIDTVSGPVLFDVELEAAVYILECQASPEAKRQERDAQVAGQVAQWRAGAA